MLHLTLLTLITSRLFSTKKTWVMFSWCHLLVVEALAFSFKMTTQFSLGLLLLPTANLFCGIFMVLTAMVSNSLTIPKKSQFHQSSSQPKSFTDTSTKTKTGKLENNTRSATPRFGGLPTRPCQVSRQQSHSLAQATWLRLALYSLYSQPSELEKQRALADVKNESIRDSQLKLPLWT